jgi:hypothetical protein
MPFSCELYNAVHPQEWSSNVIMIFGLHFAWNICESVLFGLVNSGAARNSILIFVVLFDVYCTNAIT